MKALVIGGTGPTGPHIIEGLLDRGYQVAMLNRGSRDTSDIARNVERIVADPHFRETLEPALTGRTFDLVIATYGRIRYVVDVVESKTDRLITVGGPPSYRGFSKPDVLSPAGLPVPVPEDAARVENDTEERFGYLIRRTEDRILECHAAGHALVTHFRYPVVYGPREVRPTNVWWTMRRCLDKRPHLILADNGLTIVTRGFSENMAQAVLYAVDKPEPAAGQIYNCGDIHQYTVAQWIEYIASLMDWEFKMVSVPNAYASPSWGNIPFRGSTHQQMLDLHKIRAELGYVDRVPAPEAIRETVEHFRNHPPALDAAYEAELRHHYDVEDKLVDIAEQCYRQMAELPHIEKDYHHAYAHPKAPGLERDHRER